MTTYAFIQARMGSSRLPGKVLAPLAGEPALLRIVQRVSRAEPVDAIAVLTSDNPRDEPIASLCAASGVMCVRGSEQDVLDRFQVAAAQLQADVVVRITADCPLVDPEVVSDLLGLFASRPDVAYASVATGVVSIKRGLRRFPDGLDAEVFSATALEDAWHEARDAYEREHVTPFIWRRSERFPAATLECAVDLGDERWTVDHPEDLELIRAIYDRLPPPFGWREVLAVLEHDPELRRLNVAHRAAVD